MRPTPTQLREHLSYNRRTGLLRWRKPFTHRRLGIPIQTKDCYGYIVIKFYGKMYKAHRVAWAMVKGRWPRRRLDHKDGVPHNNKWVNLRSASRQQNHANSKLAKNNTLGFKGVHAQTLGDKFEASIKVNGKTKHLGSFVKPKLAHLAYVAAAKKHFGEFARAR